MFDGSSFHRVHHLVGHPENRVVSKADQNGLVRSVFRKTWRGQRGGNHRREITVADARHASYFPGLVSKCAACQNFAGSSGDTSPGA